MEAIFIKLIFSIFISFLLTLYFVPLCKHLAVKLGILDMPDGKIKNHENPTPYLGGIAVYLGFLISLSLVYPLKNDFLFFLLVTTLLLFIGLIDDIVIIKPYQKFFGQCIATFCFLKAGLLLKEPFVLNNYWSIPLSALWMLSVINAFNLVDVMDGLATSLAIYVTTSFLCIALLLSQYQVALLLGSLLGALCAFFYYNRPKASIYLGDSGSLFIGGFLAMIPFLLHLGTYNSYGFLAPLIILAIPLLEVVTLVVIRSYKGIPFYQGSPDHFSLYLKRNGWSIKGILLYVTFLSFFLNIIAILLLYDALSLSLAAFFALLFFCIWFSMLNVKCIKPSSSST